MVPEPKYDLGCGRYLPPLIVLTAKLVTVRVLEFVTIPPGAVKDNVLPLGASTVIEVPLLRYTFETLRPSDKPDPVVATTRVETPGSFAG